MRIPLFGLLLLAPLAAAASDNNCRHSAPRSLALDLAGVKTVRVETHQHEVRLRAAPGASHALQGRACASQPEWLADLTLTQERQGDTLVVRARREREGGLSNLFGNHYARLELSGTVPDHLPVLLEFLSTRPLADAREILTDAGHILVALGELAFELLACLLSRRCITEDALGIDVTNLQFSSSFPRYKQDRHQRCHNKRFNFQHDTPESKR